MENSFRKNYATFARRLRRNISKLWGIIQGNGLLAAIDFAERKRRGCNKPVSMKFNGHELWLRPGTPDLDVAFSCLTNEFDILRQVVDPERSGLIIDAGGYIGTAAIALAEMFPRATVISIEPADENLNLLKKNVMKHPNILPMHGALVPKSHVGQIRLVDRGAGEWGFSLYGEESDQMVPSSARPLSINDLLAFAGADEFMLIKMDIEGAEFPLLQEGNEWLPKTAVLFVELHPDIYPDIIHLYHNACKGRDNSGPNGEKFLSVRV